MSIASRAWDALVLLYFVTHIPATLLIDAQAALPAVGLAHPPFARELLAWYCGRYGDPMMCTRPAWFVAIVWVELTLQLPFFVVAIAAWLARARWIRIPMLVYGAHVATTLVPIYGALWEARHTLAPAQLAFLASVYAPYLVMPLLLLGYAAADRLWAETDAGAAGAAVAASRRKAQ